jgi:hypothetical protein
MKECNEHPWVIEDDEKSDEDEESDEDNWYILYFLSFHIRF